MTLSRKKPPFTLHHEASPGLAAVAHTLPPCSKKSVRNLSVSRLCYAREKRVLMLTAVGVSCPTFVLQQSLNTMLSLAPLSVIAL